MVRENLEVDGSTSGGTDSLLGYRAAVLRYVEKKNKREIALEMGISRFRVARLLDQVLATGTVKVSVSVPFGEDVSLAEELKGVFGLKEALVLSISDYGDGIETRSSVAALVAAYLQESLHTGQVLGVSWGRTIDAVVHATAAVEAIFPRCDIVQMIGGLPTLPGALHASEVLRRLGSVMSGSTYELQSPLILPDVEIAAGMRAEPSVARSLNAVRLVDVAVLGVGSWLPHSSGLLDVLSEADVAIAHQAGVLADVCGILVDGAGKVVAQELSDRMVSATWDDLQVIPLRLAVATGPAKVGAIKAAIAANAINGLATDAVTARALLIA